MSAEVQSQAGGRRKRVRIDWRALVIGAPLTIALADGLWFGLSAWIGPPRLDVSYETRFLLAIDGAAVGGILAGTIVTGFLARPGRAIWTALLVGLLVSVVWGVSFVILLPVVVLISAAGGWLGSELRQLMRDREQEGGVTS